MSSMTVTTEDHVTLTEGDRAYNYYDMKPGKIGKIETEGSFRGWFDFHHDDGSRAILNGQRICSSEFAKERKFRDA